jgi:hypothetical protein
MKFRRGSTAESLLLSTLKKSKLKGEGKGASPRTSGERDVNAQ